MRLLRGCVGRCCKKRAALRRRIGQGLDKIVEQTAAYARTRRRPARIGFVLSPDELATARKLLRDYPAVDAHAHPGRSFVRDGKHLGWKLELYRMMGTFEDSTLADMQAGGMAGAVFNGVADFQVLGIEKDGLTAAREFRSGEAWKSYETQIASLKKLGRDGLVRLTTTAAEIRASHGGEKQAAVLAMEGADFLEGDLSRLDRVYEDGVRMLTLIHYRDNTLGDTMTGMAGSRGLTLFGHKIVEEMNSAGILVDLAHASEQTAFDALRTSAQPVVVSHTHINGPELHHARFISRSLGRAVADSGGFIGAWPAGIGIDDLAGFVDRIEALLNLVGEDHVALGSDMDANYKPVLETYRKMPLVVGALQRRGYAERQIAKFIGGNFLRVLEDVQRPVT